MRLAKWQSKHDTNANWQQCREWLIALPPDKYKSRPFE